MPDIIIGVSLFDYGGRKTMKLRCSFELVEMGDECILVPVGDGATEIHGVVKMNQEGREIIELLKNTTSEEAIINILANKYENGRAELERYVHKAIQELKDAGLLT